MINQVDCPIILKADDGSIYNIQSKSVLVPPSLLNATFYIGLTDDENCQDYFTSPLQLSNQEWHFHGLIPSVDGIVPLEGICHIKVCYPMRFSLEINIKESKTLKTVIFRN